LALKTHENIIIKSVTLSVLVLYLVMVCAYIFLIPKYNQASTIASAKTAASIQSSNNSSNSFVRMHCAFKCVPENKRKAIDVLMKTAPLIFLLVFGGITLSGSIRKAGLYLNDFLSPQRHYYLGFRTLRI
jgi:hypothetical protein